MVPLDLLVIVGVSSDAVEVGVPPVLPIAERSRLWPVSLVHETMRLAWPELSRSEWMTPAVVLWSLVLDFDALVVQVAYWLPLSLLLVHKMMSLAPEVKLEWLTTAIVICQCFVPDSDVLVVQVACWLASLIGVNDLTEHRL